MLSFSESLYGVIDLLQKRKAPDQGGILSGADPTDVNLNDPLRLWILQVVLIVFMSQLLGFFLRKIRQPSVIAEIAAGIILGPTAMGRIPGFTDHIFPHDSLPFLTLTANIGLVLYLFIVGLEIEGSQITRNSRKSITIALCAMCIPFSIGVGVSKVIYKNFLTSEVKYTHYMLFNGVSFSITAFPVLCRILTELKLLDTSVGVVALSAGVCNDIVGWTLLALAVALVNASSGLTALWVILTTLGYAIFLITAIRWVFYRFARYTNSLDGTPSFLFMTITMMFVLCSAFFTDVIGVHAIFGGFLAGLAVPREGGLAISLTEKLEDMVAAIFLPLYFTISGLSTNLGLLNTGKIWGFTFFLIFMDWCGKFTGGTLGARLSKFRLREAATVGTLMSCKGLVELVVLNIGRQAGILTTQVFSMFVLDALFLTFCTTPVVSTLYPPHLRIHVSRPGHPGHKGDEEGGAQKEGDRIQLDGATFTHKTRFTVLLDKFDHLPAVMSLSRLLSSSNHSVSNSISSDADSIPSRKERLVMTQPMSVTALRLIELTDRSSTLMKSAHAESLARTDPLLKIFRTVGDLNDANVSNELTVVPLSSFGRAAGQSARGSGSDLLVLGWASTTNTPQQSEGDNPFDYLLRSNISETTNTSQVIRSVFKDSTTDVALFMDQRTSASDSYCHKHIFLPFFGGADDRAALQLVVQLCLNPRLSATVVKVVKGDSVEDNNTLAVTNTTRGSMEKTPQEIAASGFTIQTIPACPDTIYGHQNTAHQLQSTLADNMLWESCISPPADSLHLPALRRIKFATVPGPELLKNAIDYANNSVQLAELSRGRLLVFVGRSRTMQMGPAETLKEELTARLEKNGQGSGELRKTIGDPATGLISARIKADLLVVQATRQQVTDEA